MKNKLLKPILLTLLASSLVACDSNEMAEANKNTEENEIVEEVKDDDMNDDNKAAEDNIDKDKLEDTKEDKEELEKDTIEVAKKDSDDKKEENSNEKNPEEDSKLHEKDGKYVTTMIAKLKGEADEYITATGYDYKFEDDKFLVSGSLEFFENPEDYENFEEVENQADHAFVINDQTEFQAVGGTAPAQKFTKEEFLNYLEECKDSGLALIIFVEDGVATSVSISS